MKKIGIDIHVFNNFYQGSRTYLKNIILSLLSIDDRNQYYLYTNSVEDSKRILNLKSNNVIFRKYHLKNPIGRLALNIPYFELKDGLDIFHSQYISPIFSHSKEIVTIHDILFESYPDYFSPFFIFRSKWLVKRSAKRAERIFTVSHFCKQEIVDKYGISEDKIEVTYNGIDFNVFHPNHSAEAKDKIRKKYNLKNRIILTVGRLDPRKNHVSLVKAFNMVMQKKNLEYDLVMIGQRHFGYDKIFNEIKNTNVPNRIKTLENVNDNELAIFYNLAEFFVYPSVAEGFGIPVLEAMACGLPVITSNKTSLPEIVNEAGISIDTTNVDLMAQVIEYLCENPREKVRLSNLSIAQSKKFSWYKSAKTVFKVYEEI
jgi:glycosyltransferase involved in cell wall biosynthesis